VIVYLAGRYSRQAELLKVAEVLDGYDIDVNSRWLFGDHEMRTGDHSTNARYATEDLEDIRRADVLVAFSEPSTVWPIVNCTSPGRGGRHVELGFALGIGRHVAVVGPVENVFCDLPVVAHFTDLPNLYLWLRKLKSDLRIMETKRRG
jgi:hypothetical protein